jgi:hypothetical protein
VKLAFIEDNKLEEYMTQRAAATLVSLQRMLHDNYCPVHGTKPNEQPNLGEIFDLIEKTELTTKEKMYIAFVFGQALVGQQDDQEEEEDKDLVDENILLSFGQMGQA